MSPIFNRKNKMMKHLYIGIDPDVDENGFSVWNKPQQKFESIEALNLVDMMRRLHELRDQIALVVVEAGWLNKGNRHLNYVPKSVKVRNPLAYAAEAGENTGRNHQRGMDIIEVLEYMEIPYRITKPMSPNNWKNDADIFKKMTGWKGRTNPEKRDSAMLVYNI